MRLVPYTDNFGEKNDCTVRAASAALGITYHEAYVELARLGRKPNHGFRFHLVADKFNFTLIRHMIGKYTVGQFCAMHPNGKYVIRTFRHAFVIDRNLIYDYTKPKKNQRITHVWLVSGEIPTPHEIDIDF